MWNVFLWFIIGGGVGWLAWRYLRSSSPGLVGDIVVGALGALIVNLSLSFFIPGFLNPSFMNVLALAISVVAAVAFVIVTHAAIGAVRATHA